MLQGTIVLDMLLRSRSLVQQTQVCLPADRNDAAKDASVLDRDICEAECGDCRPELAAVDPACGYGVPNSLYDFVERSAGEEGLHAEEIRVEDWREKDLVHHDLPRYQHPSQLAGRVYRWQRTLVVKLKILEE